MIVWIPFYLPDNLKQFYLTIRFSSLNVCWRWEGNARPEPASFSEDCGQCLLVIRVGGRWCEIRQSSGRTTQQSPQRFIVTSGVGPAVQDNRRVVALSGSGHCTAVATSRAVKASHFTHSASMNVNMYLLLVVALVTAAVWLWFSVWAAQSQYRDTAEGPGVSAGRGRCPTTGCPGSPWGRALQTLGRNWPAGWSQGRLAGWLEVGRRGVILTNRTV